MKLEFTHPGIITAAGLSRSLFCPASAVRADSADKLKPSETARLPLLPDGAFSAYLTAKDEVPLLLGMHSRSSYEGDVRFGAWTPLAEKESASR